MYLILVADANARSNVPLWEPITHCPDIDRVWKFAKQYTVDNYFPAQRMNDGTLMKAVWLNEDQEFLSGDRRPDVLLASWNSNSWMLLERDLSTERGHRDYAGNVLQAT